MSSLLAIWNDAYEKQFSHPPVVAPLDLPIGKSAHQSGLISQLQAFAQSQLGSAFPGVFRVLTLESSGHHPS